jgi:hypothetical protein
MLMLPVGSGALAPWRLAVWLVAQALGTVWLVRFCRRHTAGEWRWRWGSGS